MRASPPVRLEVAASPRWRWAVILWCVLVAAVSIVWAAGSATFTGAWVWLAAGVASGFATWVTRQVLTQPARLLAWDGQSWRCAPNGTDIEDASPGALQACIDLGGWMLVRHLPTGGRTGTWLPIQRRADDPAWHLFRCAVYCARPEVGGPPHDTTPGASRRTDTAA